jgi:type VI secretion system secreted protein Hcp
MRVQKLFLGVVVLGVALLFGSHCGWAALPAYVEIVGAIQGEILGSCTIEGREGNIVAYSFGHNIISPRDAASGLPTGKRQHSPLKILKEIDKSSPLLYQALVRNENLTRVKLKFYRISDKTGLEELYFTIELLNASISSITPSFPTAFLSQNDSYRHMETIAFCYQKITWTWVDGGITAHDDWEAPVT